MGDIARDIVFRGFKVNDQNIEANIVPGDTPGTGIAGCKVSTFDYSDVDIVQATEKRAEQDGMDASPPFKGMRRVRASGTLYQRTRALLFDDYWTFRAAMDPVLAYRESPADKGYRPLMFSVPTNRVTDYPAGAIDLQLYAMPRAVQMIWSDQAQGGADDDQLAITWQATWICKDPAIYAQLAQDYVFTPGSAEITGTTGAQATDLFTKASHGLVANDRIRFGTLTGGAGLAVNTDYYIIASGLTSSAFKVSLTQGGAAVNFTTDVTACVWTKTKTFAGNLINRGTYITPLNMLLVVGPRAGTITVQAGDSVFSLVIPASSGSRIVRVKGVDKVCTIEEGGVELPRQDVVQFTGSFTWAMVPPGTSGYSVTFAGLGTFDPTSHAWFWEAYS